MDSGYSRSNALDGTRPKASRREPAASISGLGVDRRPVDALALVLLEERHVAAMVAENDFPLIGDVD